MSQETFETTETQTPTPQKLTPSRAEEHGVPGPIVLAGIGVFVLFFPLLMLGVNLYAKALGASEGLKPGYKAMRDPLAWLFMLWLVLMCVWLGGKLGRIKHPK